MTYVITLGGQSVNLPEKIATKVNLNGNNLPNETSMARGEDTLKRKYSMRMRSDGVTRNDYLESNYRSMTITKIKFVLAVIPTAFFLCSACDRPQKVAETPNIVWITSEDNSTHYMELFDPNGAPTPNIEWLANNGLTFRNAYSNAPVCSVARSTLISGCYGPRVGAQYHRKMVQVSMPSGLKMFPQYLREAGYHTTNNHKEDYNFYKGDSVWDESSKEASWKNRQPGQPFFHVINFTNSHESSLHFTEAQMDAYTTFTDPQSVKVFPNHPETELFRYTNAYYRDRIMVVDTLVGKVLDELRGEGLLENTIVFYFADHGGVLPGSKGYLYETGLHVPLVVFVPEKYRSLVPIAPGEEIQGFVSFVDFAPTVLNLAGIEVPQQMDGAPFLGPGINEAAINSRDLSFSYADRFDEKYDLVRAVRKGRYKYIRNYQPFNFDGLMNNYRYKMLAYQQWDSLFKAGSLNETQALFFQTKPVEMLYDLEVDPHETANLAADPDHQIALTEMRDLLNQWMIQNPDLSLYPEHHLIENAFDDPVTFGQAHQSDIAKYLEVANLSLGEFDQVKQQLESSLQSSDPWERYWALITCNSFEQEAREFQEIIERISHSDNELINRVRAAEYLGLSDLRNPGDVMLESLYTATDPAEALLILNSIVLMESFNYQYEFDIDTAKLHANVREHDQVQRRIQYLTM
jgi:arylsulfatase A-like enzyme